MDAVKLPIYGGRYFASTDGHIYNRSGLRLSGGKNSKGYLCVSLFDGSRPKRPKSFLVHRLVAEAFIGPSSLTVNHIDGNKLNNAISNLEYLTVAENIRHGAEVLHSYSGQRNSNCKLTTEQVQEIRSSTDSCSVIAERYKMTSDYIREIRRMKARVHG